DDVGLALGSHVLHPFALAEHRHEIVLALVPGYDERNSVGPTGPPPLHLQSHLPTRWQPEGRPSRPKAGECFTQARSSPALVEPRDGNEPKRLWWCHREAPGEDHAYCEGCAF